MLLRWLRCWLRSRLASFSLAFVRLAWGPWTSPSQLYLVDRAQEVLDLIEAKSVDG
jgi:hypothetical protein